MKVRMNKVAVMAFGLLTSTPADSMQIISTLKTFVSKVVLGEAAGISIKNAPIVVEEVPRRIFNPSDHPKVYPVNFDELLSEKAASDISREDLDELLDGTMTSWYRPDTVAAVLLAYFRNGLDPLSKAADGRIPRDFLRDKRATSIYLWCMGRYHNPRGGNCMNICDDILGIAEVIQMTHTRYPAQKAKLLSLLDPKKTITSKVVSLYGDRYYIFDLDKRVRNSILQIAENDPSIKAALDSLETPDPRVSKAYQRGEVDKKEEEERERKQCSWRKE